MLSKSQYIRGLQCHKSLWLYKHNRDLRDKVSSKQESLFNTGHTVGEYAKQLFPGGVEVDFNSDDFDGMIKKTADLIEQGVETIYEATFKEKGVFAMADILHKTSNGWNIYEVKASTSTKEYRLNDATVQYYALSNVLEINEVFIVHINNQYVRHGELDIESLFIIDDVTEDVLVRQDEIKENLESLDTMLQGEMPEIDIGPHCSDPYGCDFMGHCWGHIPPVSVFNLYRMNASVKFDLYNEGIVTFEDIPDDWECPDCGVSKEDFEL